MHRPVLPDDACPLGFAVRVFEQWRACRASAAEPVPPPLVEIARTLLECFAATDISAALDVPVSMLGAAANTTAFVALPSVDPKAVADGRIDRRGDIIELDELVIDRPDGTRIRLRGRLRASASCPTRRLARSSSRLLPSRIVRNSSLVQLTAHRPSAPCQLRIGAARDVCKEMGRKGSRGFEPRYDN